MFKGILYLIGFVWVVLIILGNSLALSIFFGAIVILCIGNVIIEKIEKKKSK